jgi:hypothetical protein
MPTITITQDAISDDFYVYTSLADANNYMVGSTNWTAWSALTSAAQERSLVEAARLLDRQKWKSDYNTQAKREAVQDILDASVELSFLIGTGEDAVITSATTFDSTKRVKADVVEIENFRSFNAADAPKRFPQKVHELLRDYLAGSGGKVVAAAPSSSGTSKTSDAFDDWDFTT